jgi:hypothetical protein
MNMNCLEARNDFVAFWQKTLLPDRRALLLAHLRECSGCDHSFRVFAVTAPLLYSAVEPVTAQTTPGVTPNLVTDTVRVQQFSRPHTNKSRLMRVVSRALAASMFAAAAALALYFAAPPQMTFEDAIGADNSNVEAVSYPSVDSFFGRELVAEDSANQDFSDD